MARGNRETKKPKQVKAKQVAVVPAPVSGQRSAPKPPMPKKR